LSEVVWKPSVVNTDGAALLIVSKLKLLKLVINYPQLVSNVGYCGRQHLILIDKVSILYHNYFINYRNKGIIKAISIKEALFMELVDLIQYSVLIFSFLYLFVAYKHNK